MNAPSPSARLRPSRPKAGLRGEARDLPPTGEQALRNAETASAGETSTPLQQRAYDALRGMIADGRIAAGEKLSEAQVMRAFGIGRSPAHIALATLCADGLIVPNAGRGYLVTDATGALPPGAIGRAAQLDKIELAGTPQWQRMYAEIERELYARILLGSVRITEEGLAEHFKVSRTVVRGVMARMHAAGIISQNAGKHWVAEQVTAERVHHLHEMRRLLEPTALLHAAPHVSQSWLAEVRAKLSHWIDADCRNGHELNEAETDLHVTLLSHCANQEITTALARTHLLFAPAHRLAVPHLHIPGQVINDAFVENLRIAEALAEHLDIIDALRAKDPAAAARLLAQHISEADRRWSKRFAVFRQLKQPDLPPYLNPIA